MKSKSVNLQCVSNITFHTIENEFQNINFDLINKCAEKIWVYGSLVDGTYNSQSDIDIWVVPLITATKKDKREISNFLKKFIKDKFELQSDVIFGDEEDAKILSCVKKELLWGN